MQFGYMIIPVAISKGVSEDVRRFVTQQPKERWALFQFPVACDTESGSTFYFEDTAMCGAFFFSDMRAIVEQYIA